MISYIDLYLHNIYCWWECYLADSNRQACIEKLEEELRHINQTIEEKDPDKAKRNQLDDLSTFNSNEEIEDFLESITFLMSLLSVKHYAEIVLEKIKKTT